MIHFEQRGAVALVTIDRPERRNAVDHEALEQLTAALDRATASVPATRVLGARPAPAGTSVPAPTSPGSRTPAFATVLRGVLDRLRDAPLPTIAAVDGAALGAGTQLAIACDLRVATRTSSIRHPGGQARLDGRPLDGAAPRAARRPRSGAAPCCWPRTCSTATTPSGWGSRSEPATSTTRSAWADEIAALAPLTIQGHKLMLNRLEPDVGRDPDVAAAFKRAWESDDLREGLAAFHERRPPEFRGE